MRDTITPIASRLTKLLLMLSSDNDGEVLNAARAIGRMLQEHDADWHDLVGILLTLDRPQEETRTYDDENDDIDWHLKRNFCLVAFSHLLRPRERDFVRSLGHWRGRLTSKQSDWLNAIYARLRRHGDAS